MKLIREVAENVQYLTELTESGSKKLFIEGVFLVGDQVNRNNRMYKMDTLRKEVHRYTEELINNNRALGELGHPACFHGKTEVLTVEGWKYIKDTKIGEYVYTLNLKNKDVELNQIKSVYNEPYNGDMISIKGRMIETLVTPNHRFILEKRNGEFEFKTSLELLEENNNNHYKIPKYSNTINLKNTVKNDITIGNFTINFNDFCIFMGIYLSEGCTSHRKGRKDSYIIQISQNEGEKANKIRNILNNLPFKFSEYVRKNGHIVWKCHNFELAEYLFVLGGAADKYVPKDLIDNMDNFSANLFIEAFLLGDGRGQLNKKYQRADVFSISEKLIDDICHISFIAGIATRKFSEICTKDYKFAGRIIKKDNKKELFFCRFIQSSGIYLDKRFIHIEKINNYNDNVYCLTVDNGTFYVRDGEYTFWTGNSPSLNLERVSHKIVSLKENGNTFVGKALILETPYGQIAKNLIDNGVKLGVSSRALGTLSLNKEGYSVVNDDLKIFTAADIVADPSGPNCFVGGIMEGKEFWYDLARNSWIEKDVEILYDNIKKFPKHQIEEQALNMFNWYLTNLCKK